MVVAQGIPGHPATVSSGHSSRIATAGWTGAPGAGTVQGRLHDFVKCALLQQLVPPGATVCDLYCGRGTDTEKWARAQIGRYVGVDFAASALEEAREKWDDHNRPYPADFCEVDPGAADLQSQLRHMGLPADFVCCMGHLQDLFFNEEVAKKLLENVASILKPGGYFFGITVDSSTIWLKYQKAAEKAIKAGSLRSTGALPRVNSEHYVISFEDDRFTPFGTKYTLQFADELISHSQILVHFPSLIRLAEEVGLEYVEIQNLQEFYEDYRVHFIETLRATCGNLMDPRGRLMLYAYDVLSLYTTFIFKKADQSEPGFTLSPLPLADEDQLESYSKKAIDLNIAPQQEQAVLPDELKVAAGSLIQSSIHNHADEADGWRLGKDHRSFHELSTMQSPISGKGENGKHACSYDDQPLDRRLVNSIRPKECDDGTKFEHTEFTTMNDSKDLEADSQQFRPENESKTSENVHLDCSSKQSGERCVVEAEHDGKGAAGVNWGKLGIMEKKDLERYDTNKRLELGKSSVKELPENPQQLLFDEIQQCHLHSKEKDQKQGVSEGFTLGHELSQEHHHSVKTLLGDGKHEEESMVPCSVLTKVKYDPGLVAEAGGSLQSNSEGEEPLMKDLDTVELLKLDNPVSISVVKPLNQGENTERETKEKGSGEIQQVEISCNVIELMTKSNSPYLGEPASGSVLEPCYRERVFAPPLGSMSFVEHREKQVDMDSGSKGRVGSEDYDLTELKEVHARDKMLPSTKYERAVVMGREKNSEVDWHTYKSSTRRMHTHNKEEPYTGRGKNSSDGAQSERASRQHGYRSSEALGRSYYHSSHVERHEQSPGSRHVTSASHTSYNSRTSKDQRVDSQSRHELSHRSDDLRNWHQHAYSTSSHVNFLPMASRQELPSHELGILGPRPSSLVMPEAMRGFYSRQTSQAPEKRVSSKDRPSCNLRSDQDGYESKFCKDSSYKHWRDSPPPGTNS